MAGDPQAFTLLVQRHRDRLWAVAVRTLGDPDEAADALQEALISALRGAGSFRGEAAVTTWLHRIVVNACLDRIRRHTVRPTVPLGDRDVAWGADPQSQVDARITVRAALTQLPEEQRDAVVLIDLEDLSVAEAARMLGVPEGTVKSRCSRGRTALAALLGQDGEASSRSGNPRGRSRVASTGAHDLSGLQDDQSRSGGW